MFLSSKWRLIFGLQADGGSDISLRFNPLVGGT
jgi:hypothetical protein